MQKIGNREALILDRQGFAVVTLAAAHFARDVHVREEAHLDLTHAVALACFATSAFDIEAEAACLIASRSGLRQHGVKLANRREHSRIGCGIGAWRSADRR